MQNSISVGNCNRMSAPIPGAPSSYNQYLSLFCRFGGDSVTFNFFNQDVYEYGIVEFSTFSGYNPTFFDVQCNPPCTNYTYLMRNNIIAGYSQNNQEAPNTYYLDYDPSNEHYYVGPTVQDHNIYWGMRSCPAKDSTEACVNPMLLGDVGPTISQESSADAANFGLKTGSPAIRTGVPVPGITTDLLGKSQSLQLNILC